VSTTGSQSADIPVYTDLVRFNQRFNDPLTQNTAYLGCQGLEPAPPAP
jgi:hypothetical protein